jgi:hypothetical protein
MIAQEGHNFWSLFTAETTPWGLCDVARRAASEVDPDNEPYDCPVCPSSKLPAHSSIYHSTERRTWPFRSLQGQLLDGRTKSVLRSSGAKRYRSSFCNATSLGICNSWLAKSAFPRFNFSTSLLQKRGCGGCLRHSARRPLVCKLVLKLNKSQQSL